MSAEQRLILAHSLEAIRVEIDTHWASLDRLATLMATLERTCAALEAELTPTPVVPLHVVMPPRSVTSEVMAILMASDRPLFVDELDTHLQADGHQLTRQTLNATCARLVKEHRLIRVRRGCYRVDTGQEQVG